jgi:hypothetical protein
MRGRITIPGDKPPGVTVSLEGADPPLGEAPSAGAGDDGRFTLKDVFPGKYTIRVRGLPENCYIRAVKLGGQEIDENAAEIGGSAAELEIVVSRGGAGIDGVVSGADDKPAQGATVAIMPGSGRESSYASTTTDQNGAFTLKSLTPGKYKVLAWEEIEAGAFRDPDYVQPFEGRAEAVVLEESAHVKLSLKVIPAAK